jgi:hypothetical protein
MPLLPTVLAEIGKSARQQIFTRSDGEGLDHNGVFSGKGKLEKYLAQKGLSTSQLDKEFSF